MYQLRYTRRPFVNPFEPGANYGWPDTEGATNDERFTGPIAEWGTDEDSTSGIAIAAGCVWMAALQGECLWRIPLDDDQVLQVKVPDRLSSGPSGSRNSRARFLPSIVDPQESLVSTSRLRWPLRTGLLALAIIPLAVVPATTAAGGSVAVGNARTPLDNQCAGITIIQATSADNAYVIPADGVVTSFRFVQGAQRADTIAFKLAHKSATDPAPNAYSVVATTAVITPGPGGLVDQAVRLPARSGDVLGMALTGTSTDCAIDTASAQDAYTYVVGNAGVGPMTGAGPLTTKVVIDVAATWEPDVDRDGYGDVTQDDCTTDATTPGPCTPPDTTISSASVKKNKVTVVFAASKPGSTFQCAVDSPIYVACTSPFVKKLKPGKHLLAVRAVNAAGVDATPATKSVKIKKPKKAKKN